MLAEKIIKVKQIKGLIGVRADHRCCVKGLGFKKIGQILHIADTPSVRGMIKKVPYLVEIVN